MATKAAIANAIKMLAVNFRHSPDPQLPDLWLAAFADLTDEQMQKATVAIVSTDDFFPTVKRVRDVLGLNHKPKPDVAGTFARLRALTTYHPNTGDTMPSVERVREELGDAIADAYGFVGPKRLEAAVFDGTGTGADIAAREFAEQLEAAQDAGLSVALPPMHAMKLLGHANQTASRSDQPQRIGGMRPIAQLMRGQDA